MFRNPKGQEVGWVEGRAYKTKRNARDGQIYLIKHSFAGKTFDLPIGIQKSILNRLKEKGVKFIDVLISGIEKYPYWTRTSIEDIYMDGVLIKEDRSNTNITKWGYQYIWDIKNRRKEMVIQATLK